MSHRGATGPSSMANAVVGPQKELARDLSQGAEAIDQGMLERACRGCRLSRPREVPDQKLAGMAIDDEG